MIRTTTSNLGHKVTVLPFAIVVALACGSTVYGNLIVNGDFEDVTGTFPNGWTNSGPGSQESAASSSFVISDSESLRLSGGAGNVQQTITSGLSDFTLSFDWRRPFTSVTTQRMMNFHLRQGTATPFVNMRVSGSEDIGGSLQLFDPGAGGGWNNLDPSGAATELILSTETAYTFTITGSDFGTGSASYDLSVLGGTVNETFTGLTIFQNDPFTAGELADTVRFERGSNHGSATFDNVSLVAVPEASQILALSMVCAVTSAVRAKRKRRAQPE